MCRGQISQIRACRSRVCAEMARFSRVPNPLVSDEEAQRFRHADVSKAQPAELRRELTALRQIVAILPDPDAWHLERIQQLEQAIHHVE